MADRPTITTLSSGALYDTDTLNTNFTALRDAFDAILGLNGTAGANNTMTGSVDWANNIARNVVLDTPTSTVSTLPDGAVGAPAFSFTSDLDTGMFLQSANTLGFSTSGALSFVINGSTTPVNYIILSATDTGNDVSLIVTGDTNRGINHYSNGTGSHSFLTGGVLSAYEQFEIINTTTAVNYVQVAGGTTGNAPLIAVTGTDSDVDMELWCKGTGGVYVGSATGGAQGTDTFNCSGLYVDGVAVGSGLPRSYLAGMGMSNDTDTAHDILFAAGSCTDSTNAADIVETALTKQIDASWAVGDDQGGLDTGAVAANKWYHCWAIKRSDTAVTDFLFSLSVSAPTMPTSYDFKRRIGAVLTDASANIIQFTQTGDLILWSNPALDITNATPGTTANTGTLVGVPLGVVTNAILNISAANNTNIYMSALVVDDEAPSVTAAPLATGASASGANGTQATVLTNTSKQIRYRASANTAIYFSVLGYYDTRGRND